MFKLRMSEHVPCTFSKLQVPPPTPHKGRQGSSPCNSWHSNRAGRRTSWHTGSSRQQGLCKTLSQREGTREEREKVSGTGEKETYSLVTNIIVERRLPEMEDVEYIF